MQLLRRSIPPPEKPAGLPLWVLMATAPVVVSLGLLFGVATAIYWAPSDPVTPPPTSEVVDPVQAPSPIPGQVPMPVPAPVPTPVPRPAPDHTPPDPTPPVSSEPPSSPRVTFRPSDDSFATQLDPLGSLEPIRSPGEVTPATSPTQQTPPMAVVRDVRGARSELVRSFSTFQAGSVTVSNIDYQQMLNRSQSTSIVGILSLESYSDWNRALDLEPKHLQAWLESAAKMALPATRTDRIFMSWAVVDVRNARPSGFAAHEVTELSNGTFLVIRQLASTISHLDPVITLRSRESLAMSARLGPNEGGPWTTYTPVLNFDSTDKYRPPNAAGTRPR